MGNATGIKKEIKVGDKKVKAVAHEEGTTGAYEGSVAKFYRLSSEAQRVALDEEALRRAQEAIAQGKYKEDLTAARNSIRFNLIQRWLQYGWQLTFPDGTPQRQRWPTDG